MAYQKRKQTAAVTASTTAVATTRSFKGQKIKINGPKKTKRNTKKGHFFEEGSK